MYNRIYNLLKKIERELEEEGVDFYEIKDELYARLYFHRDNLTQYEYDKLDAICVDDLDESEATELAKWNRDNMLAELVYYHKTCPEAFQNCMSELNVCWAVRYYYWCY